MQNFKKYIELIIEKSGPEINEYNELNTWFQSIGEMLQCGKITRNQIRSMWSEFSAEFSENTMQGFVAVKPHGYAGDFEIIDRIYTEWVSPQKELSKWDKFFHWQDAVIAVRNRKEYFKANLSKIDALDILAPLVLNVGSGSGRDLYEYHLQTPLTKINFDCLDIDKNAIEHSKKLINNKNINYICQNAFRFKSNKKYDLVWSAGLFDYLDNKRFVYLLKLLFETVAPDGGLVVGNFSDTNPSKDYMEFGEWFLHHRSEQELFQLAVTSGIPASAISIEAEPCGVNLFLRIRKT